MGNKITVTPFINLLVFIIERVYSSFYLRKSNCKLANHPFISRGRLTVSYCFLGQLFSTLQPTQNRTTTPQVRKASVPPTPTSLTTKASKITKKLPTQLPEASSKGYPVYERFKTTLAVHSSSSGSLDRHSDSSKTTLSVKVGGITVGTVALVLLVAGIFTIYWTRRKGRTRKSHQQGIDYTAVRLESGSYR